MVETQPRRKWTEYLNDEDQAFVRRFVLASGSLKELARVYGVSYPTVRLRLDKLIAKIEIWESTEIISDFERVLRALFSEGRIDMNTFGALLAAHRNELEASNE
jgi:hypothetical protein